MRPGETARARRDLPAFSSKDLVERDVVHAGNCRVFAAKSPGSSRCDCRRTRTWIPSGKLVEVVEIDGIAAQVREMGSSPTWVEVQGLTPGEAKTSLPPPAPAKRFREEPRDLQAVQIYLGKNKKPEWKRTSEDPTGGTIVILREEATTHNARKIHPLRYIGIVRRGENLHALCVDPTLVPDQVLYASWSQIREIPLPPNKGPRMTVWRVMIPAFPLPDGTEDPGWDRPRMPQG